ncbi:hypothetical protein CK203_070146 [Vitis vinifera]|uniref:Uncharacterized protein n=1 Tax=Vitis vinifera TaxID=29760 RepID=A0A438EHT5_VITVI|nr:hypothetical protein CK203_070146 [Vitis vinifera]
MWSLKNGLLLNKKSHGVGKGFKSGRILCSHGEKGPIGGGRSVDSDWRGGGGCFQQDGVPTLLPSG